MPMSADQSEAYLCEGSEHTATVERRRIGLAGCVAREAALQKSDEAQLSATQTAGRVGDSRSVAFLQTQLCIEDILYLLAELGSRSIDPGP